MQCTSTTRAVTMRYSFNREWRSAKAFSTNSMRVGPTHWLADHDIVTLLCLCRQERIPIHTQLQNAVEPFTAHDFLCVDDVTFEHSGTRNGYRLLFLSFESTQWQLQDVVDTFVVCDALDDKWSTSITPKFARSR